MQTARFLIYQRSDQGKPRDAVLFVSLMAPANDRSSVPPQSRLYLSPHMSYCSLRCYMWNGRIISGLILSTSTTREPCSTGGGDEFERIIPAVLIDHCTGGMIANIQTKLNFPWMSSPFSRFSSSALRHPFRCARWLSICRTIMALLSQSLHGRCQL
jgi:hypothetical protein